MEYDVTEVKKRAKRAPEHYVDNKEFFKAIVRYQATPRTRDYEYIGTCILKICHGLASAHNFYRYSDDWKQEMIDDAVSDCVKAINNFDPNRPVASGGAPNPFSYFTMVAWRAFIRRLGREKKEQYAKHKVLEQLHFMSDLNDGEHAGTTEFLESHYFVVSNYEEKQAEKKAKKKTKEAQLVIA